MKMKWFGLRETKLFHLHVIFKKNEIKSAQQSEPLYTYNPLSRNAGSVPAWDTCILLHSMTPHLKDMVISAYMT